MIGQVLENPIKDYQFLDKVDEIMLGYRGIKPLMYNVAQIIHSKKKRFLCFEKKDQPKAKIPMIFVNEIRAMNDHIARCYLEGKEPDQISNELERAKSHLTRLQRDVYKYMISLKYDVTIGMIKKKRYEQMNEWYDSSLLSFREQYYKLKVDSIEAAEKVKITEALGEKGDVLDMYERNLKIYLDLEQLIIDNKKNLRKITIKNTFANPVFRAILIAIVTATIPSIITNAITQ